MAKNAKVQAKPETYTITIPKRSKLTAEEREPDARFNRVIGVRVSKVLRLFKGIRNGANPAVYKYSPEQVRAMFKAMRRSLDRTEAAYANPVTPGANGTARKVTKVPSFFAVKPVE